MNNGHGRVPCPRRASRLNRAGTDSGPATPPPSGRFQARSSSPDGRTHKGPVTFGSRQYANAYLARIHSDIQGGRGCPRTRPAPPLPRCCMITPRRGWPGGTWPT